MRHLGLSVAVAVAMTFVSVSPAYAGDKPLLAPAPAWVKPAPPVDTATLTDASPVLLIYDAQQRLDDGLVWSYVDSARRVSSAEVLGAIGTIQLPWQPAQGDLIVHQAEILRGAKHIDLLKGDKSFTVLRREEGMNQRSLDGMLTATMPVEGLQVGDVLRIAFSITRRDPTLKGAMQAIAPVLAEPMRVQFARLRFVWPTKDAVHWRGYDDRMKVAPVVANGISDLTIPLPLAKPVEIPGDAPPRYQNLPIVEASSFADWASVAAVMAPLYRTEGTIQPGSPLAAEVARIMAAEKDPMKRTALALQTVQDQIRYLLLGMDTGNYVPQTPTLTWTARYGDCKAKTLLLLAMLHAMGIEAEPVLASSKLGDTLPTRLPAASAFDHVFVRATVNGTTLWLDGTNTGIRLADLQDTPPLGYVLPLRATGATLMPIVVHADARPSVATELALDETGGLEMPAPFKVDVVMRGALVGVLHLVAGQGSKDDLDKLAVNIVKQVVPDNTIATHDLRFDDGAGTATFSATGLAYTDWSRTDGRLESSLDKTVSSLDFSPDRARAAWRDIPVATGNPDHLRVTTRIHLPTLAKGQSYTLVSDAAVSTALGSNQIDRKVTQTGDILVIQTEIRNSGAEIAAAAVPETRKQYALAKSHAPRAQAPLGYPARWQDVQAGAAAHRYDAALAAYGKRLADHPDKAESYSDRAWFYTRLFDRKNAIADWNKAIAISPDVDSYLKRADLYEDLGDLKHALADAQAARDLDPSSGGALRYAALLIARQGNTPAGLALLQERIDAGGDDKADFLGTKAELLARSGDKAGALEAVDLAVAAAPGKPGVLNGRCWMKGTLDSALDTALKDCTKAIELSDNPVSALDSRALVYLRMKRYDDAMADVDAVLMRDPEVAGSLYLRSILRRIAGKTLLADADLAAARYISPQIDERYRKFGITP